jgi:plastocyanin
MGKHLIPLEVVLVSVLVACGSGEAADPAGETDAPSVPGGAESPALAEPGVTAVAPLPVPGEVLPLPQPTGARQIGVRLSEFRIEMTRNEITPGEVEFHVVNAGKVEHDFVVRSDLVYALTEHLEPGDSTILRMTLPPGEHRYLCGIRDDRDHHASGMDGFITVR